MSILEKEKVSFREINFALGYSDRWLYNRLVRKSLWLEQLRKLGFLGDCIIDSVARNSKGATLTKSLTQKDFKILLTHEACLGNPRALELLTGNKISSVKKTSKQDERKIQLRLAKEMQGQIEVNTIVGNIDLLTDTEIIEIKRWSEWKTALGQILAYSRYYPDKTKRIHLFGTFPADKAQLINEHLNSFGVVLTWECGV